MLPVWLIPVCPRCWAHWQVWRRLTGQVAEGPSLGQSVGAGRGEQPQSFRSVTLGEHLIYGLRILQWAALKRPARHAGRTARVQWEQR